MKTLEVGHPSKMEFLSIIKDLVRVQNRIMDSLFIFKTLPFHFLCWVRNIVCVRWGAVHLTGPLQEGVRPMPPETKTVWVSSTTQDLKFEFMCPRGIFPCLHVPSHLFLPVCHPPSVHFPSPPTLPPFLGGKPVLSELIVCTCAFRLINAFGTAPAFIGHILLLVISPFSSPPASSFPVQ